MGSLRQASFWRLEKWAAARAAPDAVPVGLDAYQVAMWLHPKYPSAIARMASELVALAPKAVAKLNTPTRCVFQRTALEQATPLAVARERALSIRRILQSRGESVTHSVWDATCGLGADAIALADAGLRVIASDRDPERAALAAWNLQASTQPGARFQALVADALERPAKTEFLVLDPDPRPQGRRTLDASRWSPTYVSCLELAKRHAGACIKLAPALDPARVPVPQGPHAWQWTSFGGELVELALWTGELASDRDERTATCLRHGVRYQISAHAGNMRDVGALDPAEVRNVPYLIDPDPAIIRAGLLGKLALELGFAPFAPEIAYLGGPKPPPAGPYSAWRVLASSPVDRKRVRAMLSAHDIGPLTVKKRGRPESSETLARRFRGRGENPGFLVVTRLTKGHLALLVEPL